jgi:hypothetical protein
VKRIAALAAALLLALSLPVMAQEADQPPAGAALVVAYMYDGMTWVQVPGGIAIPPLACDPA